MDAPNAPNPANPNAQDQFLDVVQGPTNQAQGPAVQDQIQGPAEVGQNVPRQPPQQQIPAQPSPVGPIVPVQPSPSTTSSCWCGSACPIKYFIKKWIGKKPEFSR